ncbi:MAG: glycosyltransferase family 4 protein [bacterium]
MKVLVFTSLYPNNVWPNFGVFIKERMTHFARQEAHQIKVVAPVPYFPPIKFSSRWKYSQVLPYEIVEGIEVHHPRYFMIPKVGMSVHGLMMFLSVLPVVAEIRKGFDFDLIDAHYVYPDGFAAVLLGRLLKKPVVLSARGSDINLFAAFPLIRRLLRYALTRADRVITVSQALKEAIIRLKIPEQKISVISNGIDLGKFHPLPKAESRERLGISGKSMILSVGALIPLKGFDLLIKAFKTLRDEHHEKNLFLAIVGEGDFRKDLEALILEQGLQEHVLLAGARPHHELNLWYSAAEVFCLLSSREGWPNVILEALACGIPVVATGVGGIPEIITSHEVGILTKREVREVSNALSAAIHRSWNADEIVRFVHARTWDKVALSIANVFEATLAAGKPAP